MINKTDLRIGNSVMYKGEAWKVEELADTAAHISQHPLWVRGHYENLEPIPITEEALVKMGAVSNPYQDRYELHGVNIECNKTRGTTELWIEFMPHVNSIHRLQNFIYSLKNIELTYD